MPAKSPNTVKQVHIRFKQFDKSMRDLWENYCLVQFYMPVLHKLIKLDHIPTFEQPSLGHDKQTHKKSKADAFGAISSFQNKMSGRWVLMSAVSRFEDYVGELATLILKEFPHKLANSNPVASDREQIKLMDLIVDSSDRKEILDRVIEEKIRGAFYGKPSDVFTKDKLSLGFKSFNSGTPEIVKYEEICARRNVVTHSEGCVDRKYLREVPGTTFKLGNKVVIGPTYIRDTIVLLQELAATATKEAVKNTLHETPSGILKRRVTRVARKTRVATVASKSP